MKKLLTFLFAVILAVGLFACGDKQTQTPEAEAVWTPVTLESNGIELSEYKIVIPSQAFKNKNSPTLYAAQILQKYVKSACQITLPIISDTTNKDGYEIVIGDTERDIDKGVDFAKLGQEAFIIKNVGDDLLLCANNYRGALYAVFDYLEALGFRFFTSDCIYIPQAEDVFVAKDVNRSWTPTMTYRETFYSVNWAASDTTIAQRVNSDFFRSYLQTDEKYGGYSGYVGGGEYMVHTFTVPERGPNFGFLPADLFKDYPEYFSLVNGVRTTSQPCYTNFDSIDTVYNNIVKKIIAFPGADIVSLSQNDNQGFCQCDNCKESYAKYGYSGTLLNYVNQIADRLAVDYPDIKLDTLAYFQTEEFPKGGVKPRDNMIIRFCPTELFPFYTNESDRISAYEQLLSKWATISNNIFIYYYSNNNSVGLSPWVNFDSLYNDITMFAKYKTTGIYAEGDNRNGGEFGELRAYLISKLLANPNMTKTEYNYHMKDFMTHYYGENAVDDIMEFIKIYRDRINQTQLKYGNDYFYPGYVWNTDIYKLVDFDWNNQTKSYDMEFINKCNELWDLAEEHGDGVDGTNHVRKSRISWDYTMLTATFDLRYAFGDEEEKQALVEQNEKLYNTMKELNVTYYGYLGNTTLNLKITDFASTPYSWFFGAKSKSGNAVFADDAPVIDGEIDGVWDNAEKLYSTEHIVSDTQAQGYVSAMHDDNGLYLLGVINDNSLCNADILNFWISEDYFKKDWKKNNYDGNSSFYPATLKEGAYSLCVHSNGTVQFYAGEDVSKTQGFSLASSKTNNQYIIEVFIPYQSQNTFSEDHVFGFNYSIDDYSSDSSSRTYYCNWSDYGSYWSTPADLQMLILK